jgi:hypothetical protein
MKSDDLVRRVYREFGKSPLLAWQQESLYVDLDQARGNPYVVGRLERTIRLPDQPTCQVLAGHRGSGKSTEIIRLKNELESGDPPFVAIYVEADEDIDRNDVDFPDVLIAVVRQLTTQLKSREGIDLRPGLFTTCFRRLQKVLTEINLDSFELNAGVVKLAGQMKASPDARLEIRKIMEPDTSNWLSAANEVIDLAVLELRKKGKAGLVVLMDDLDKMIVREHSAGGCKTDEYLFVNRAAQLTAFNCHVVYTMPLSLAYSHQEQAIKSSYGGHVFVVPMTRVTARPPDKGSYALGVEKFREIIARRLRAAKAEGTEVFASERVCDALIALSGGQPSELMSLVREAIIAHALPIDDKSLERAKSEGRREYARQLRKDHWPVIEEIRATGSLLRTEENEALFRELLESRAILQYANGDEWYGLNPMVAALKPPPKVFSSHDAS